jgi:hypothetical protein
MLSSHGPLAQTGWGITPCQLCATAHLLHSQLFCISVGPLLYPQPKDMACHGDRNPLIMIRIESETWIIVSISNDVFKCYTNFIIGVQLMDCVMKIYL